MIPGRLRLPRSRIEYLLKKGKKLGNEFFTVKYLPAGARGNGKSRFCVIVSSKLEAGAVKRNRLRRRIYEIIRLHAETRTSTNDMVIIGKIPLSKLEYEAIQKNLTNLLKKLN